MVLLANHARKDFISQSRAKEAAYRAFQGPLTMNLARRSAKTAPRTSTQTSRSKPHAGAAALGNDQRQEVRAVSRVVLAELESRVIHAQAESFVLAVTTTHQRVTSVQKDGISPTMNKEAASLAFQVNFKTRQERKNV